MKQYEYEYRVQPVGRFLWSYDVSRGLTQIVHSVTWSKRRAISVCKRYIEKDQRERARIERERVTGTWP